MVIRWIAAVVLGVVVSFVFGPKGPLGGFWRPIYPAEQPTGLLLGAFLGVSLSEGIALGLAFAVVAFARPQFFRLVPSMPLAYGGWLATVYLLASWWPHSSLHRVIGPDLGGLLAIEWIFHVGSMAAIGVLLAAVLTAEPRLTPFRTVGSKASGDSAVTPKPQTR